MIRQLNLKGPMVDILQSYGRIAAIKDDFEQGYASLQESVAICEEQGARIGCLFASTHLGYLTLYREESTNSRNILVKPYKSFSATRMSIGSCSH